MNATAPERRIATMPHADDLAVAHALADAARDITMPAWGRRLHTVRKGDGSALTAFDSAAEQAVREAISTLRPGDCVRGEEYGGVESHQGRVWVVDPIDGTKAYAEGFSQWTTLIALRVDGVVTVGLADVPAEGRRFTATLGGGAWEGDAPMGVSTVGRLGDGVVLHAAVDEWAGVGEVDALVRLCSGARGSRGIADAYGHLMVARGSAEVCVEVSACYEWDWAATSLIVREAGGSVSALEGGALYDGCRLLVTNGQLDAEVRAALEA